MKISLIPKYNIYHTDILTPLKVIHGINVWGGISASVSIPIPRRSSWPKWDTAHSWTKLIFSSLSFKFRLSMHYKNDSVSIICPKNDITSLLFRFCYIKRHNWSYDIPSMLHRFSTVYYRPWRNWRFQFSVPGLGYQAVASMLCTCLLYIRE